MFAPHARPRPRMPAPPRTRRRSRGRLRWPLRRGRRDVRWSGAHAARSLDPTRTAHNVAKYRDAGPGGLPSTPLRRGSATLCVGADPRVDAGVGHERRAAAGARLGSAPPTPHNVANPHELGLWRPVSGGNCPEWRRYAPMAGHPGGARRPHTVPRDRARAAATAVRPGGAGPSCRRRRRAYGRRPRRRAPRSLRAPGRVRRGRRAAPARARAPDRTRSPRPRRDPS